MEHQNHAEITVPDFDNGSYQIALNVAAVQSVSHWIDTYHDNLRPQKIYQETTRPVFTPEKASTQPVIQSQKVMIAWKARKIPFPW